MVRTSQVDIASIERGLSLAVVDRPDILPGEEALHERLQDELIAHLEGRLRGREFVVVLESRPGKRNHEQHSYLYALQAAPGYFSCELMEVDAQGTPVEFEFFTLAPAAEQASGASVITLAKAGAVASDRYAVPIERETFDAVCARDH